MEDQSRAMDLIARIYSAYVDECENHDGDCGNVMARQFLNMIGSVLRRYHDPDITGEMEKLEEMLLPYSTRPMP